jgi:uncharacterized membrane protein YkoI
MKIDKILNNNVVIIKDHSGVEKIVMGRGLAYKKGIGVKIKLDREDDYRSVFYVYEVEFAHDGLEYEFDIDATNKRILKSDVDSWFD